MKRILSKCLKPFIIPVFACAFFSLSQIEICAQTLAQNAAEENIQKEKASLPEIEAPTLPLESDFWEKHLLTCIISSTVALVLLLIAILHRRKKTPPCPYEIAQRRLLASESIFEEHGVKKYAEEVSQLVRDYIEARHGIPAPERTTEEFLAIAASSEIFDALQSERLSQVLKLADMAKFAALAFNEAERKTLLKNAGDFVECDNLKILENAKKKSDSKLKNENSENSSEIMEKEELK